MTHSKVPILCLLGLLFATTAHATNVYNVSDYASPQAAINAAQAAGGGLVHFPCGPTTLTAGLVVSSPGVTLEGCGPTGTTLWASFATGDIISFSNSTPFTPCGGVRSLTISPSVNRTSGYAIAIAGCGSGNFQRQWPWLRGQQRHRVDLHRFASHQQRRSRLQRHPGAC